MPPTYVYGTPSEGVPAEISNEFDDVDTALVATNPLHRGPEATELFESIDTDKIEVFPQAARMISEAETAAKWDVIGRCHDAMTAAGIDLAKASEIMATVVSEVGLLPEGPPNRGPNGTMRPHLPGDAPHRKTIPPEDVRGEPT